MVVVLALGFDALLRAGGVGVGVANTIQAALGIADPQLTLVFAGLGLLGIVASAGIKRMTLNLWADIRDNYLDFASWLDLHHKGLKWRYAMRWPFIENPEPIDALTIALMRECGSFDEFEDRITSGLWPERFKAVVDRHFWGQFEPSVADLLRTAVLQDIFRSPILAGLGKTPATIYDELRSALLCSSCHNLPSAREHCTACVGTGLIRYFCRTCGGSGVLDGVLCRRCDGHGVLPDYPAVLFMNRLQYLWMARNVGWIERRFPIWLSFRAQAIVVVLGVIAYCVATTKSWMQLVSVDQLVNGIFFGTSLLVVLTATILTLFLILEFQGSGNFELGFPLNNATVGLELWLQFTRIISAITVLAFVLYSVGMPLLLFKDDLEQHSYGRPLVLVVGLSAFIFGLFALGNFYRIHTVMHDAKRSALRDMAHKLVLSQNAAGDPDAFDYELFKEIRGVSEWPVDVSTTVAILTGFFVPTVLQVVVYVLPATR